MYLPVTWQWCLIFLLLIVNSPLHKMHTVAALCFVCSSNVNGFIGWFMKESIEFSVFHSACTRKTSPLHCHRCNSVTCSRNLQIDLLSPHKNHWVRACQNHRRFSAGKTRSRHISKWNFKWIVIIVKFYNILSRFRIYDLLCLMLTANKYMLIQLIFFSKSV